eukprot:2995046-Rhodomonas_salina.1
MSGTEVAVVPRISAIILRMCYAMPGTEKAYLATRWLQTAGEGVQVVPGMRGIVFYCATCVLSYLVMPLLRGVQYSHSKVYALYKVTGVHTQYGMLGTQYGMPGTNIVIHRY